uniref:Trace amine-associated receptor 7b-like n=2 Tax=Petromyzon marinus TaxID=7757 RepID=A0AAJ7TCA1_PETMA|nr:trace amine-associated receptor 7b-like [Petromyzon marinus]
MANLTDTHASAGCILYMDAFNCTGPTMPLPARSASLAVISLFVVTTVLGNLLIISTIAFFKQLQTSTNVLALSLAVTDFLIGLIIMPMAMTKEMFNCWFYGDVFCNVHFFIDYMLTNCSMLHLGSIALQRYVAISDPLHYATRMTRRSLAAIIGFCWLGSAVFSSPILLSFSSALSEQTVARKSCADNCLFYVHMGIMFVVGYCPYFASLLVIVCVYAKIYRIARNQMRKIRSVACKVEETTLQVIKREHNATKTLGVIIFFFLVSWLPYYLIVLSSMAVKNTMSVYRVALWAGYISSAFNPLLYASFNLHFRNAFKMMLSCKIFAPGARHTNLNYLNKATNDHN